MNKRHIISQLQKAKTEHIEWVRHARALLKDLPQHKIKKPIGFSACDFGQWFYEEGHRLINIPQLEELEELHRDIHHLYTALYYITFDRRKVARATIISAGVEVPIEEKAFRLEKLKRLEEETVRMIRLLAVIAKAVATMKERDFKNGWLVS